MRARYLCGNERPGLMAEGRLNDEIETLERRLVQMGPDGDCGYEKALIRFLEQQLGMRREWLRAADDPAAASAAPDT